MLCDYLFNKLLLSYIYNKNKNCVFIRYKIYGWQNRKIGTADLVVSSHLVYFTLNDYMQSDTLAPASQIAELLRTTSDRYRDVGSISRCRLCTDPTCNRVVLLSGIGSFCIIDWRRMNVQLCVIKCDAQIWGLFLTRNNGIHWNTMSVQYSRTS